MFVDRARLTFRGGWGGDGCCSFRREKYVPKGGPNGGHGGKGGDVYLEATPKRHTLYDLTLRPHQIAESGRNGQGSDKTGKSGKDLIVSVPCGVMVYKAGAFLCDLSVPSQRFLVARGGRGGRGNAAFKSSTNRAPKFAEKGEAPEEQILDLELKLIADVGLVGMPNAGKSTLLSRITRAHPKIASYPFTTLNPNLGLAVYDDKRVVFADLPGLIEGAHTGKGLGHEFLKHVERTRILVHLLDVTGFDGKPAHENFRVVNEELKTFSQVLAVKPQIVAVNKMDLTGAEVLLKEFKKKTKISKVYPVSSVTGEGIKNLLAKVLELLDNMPPESTVVYEELESELPERIIFEPEFRIRREGSVFVVYGKKVEDMVTRTNFDHEGGAQWLARRLKGAGVDRALKKAGAVIGDSVRIVDHEFTFRP